MYENATGSSEKFDWVVRKGGEDSAWIDAVTKDLYLKGRAYENQETLGWSKRTDYVISNDEGMYLAIFRSNGDLYLRGEVMEGGGSG